MDKKRGSDEGEEKKEEEGKGKTGRPSKVESLERERSWNIGTGRNIEEFFERKRGGKRGKVCKKSNKLIKSPEKNENLEMMMKILIEKVKEMRKEPRKQREESRKEREEIREKIRRQGKEVNERIEREERERLELKEELEEIRRRIKKMEVERGSKREEGEKDKKKK